MAKSASLHFWRITCWVRHCFCCFVSLNLSHSSTCKKVKKKTCQDNIIYTNRQKKKKKLCILLILEVGCQFDSPKDYQRAWMKVNMSALNLQVNFKLCTVAAFATCVLSPCKSTIKNGINDMDFQLKLLIHHLYHYPTTADNCTDPFSSGAHYCLCLPHTWSNRVLFDRLDDISLTVSQSEDILYKVRSPKG